KPLKVTILVKALINEKQDKKEREGEEEDGFTTPKGAMTPPKKSLKVNIPVPAPINNKPEKEEDGFTTPKGVQSRNPPQPKTPPAPSKGKPPLPERGGIRQKTIQ
ncbi:unnamed protein product, partial [Brassica oleracea]